MKKTLKVGYTLSFFICIVLNISAQTINVTVNFQNTGIKDVINDLSSKTGYKFYYNPRDIDSIIVNSRNTDLSLESVLTDIFKGTKIFYAIDKRSHIIFLTKDYTINTTLPFDLPIDSNNAVTQDKLPSTTFGISTTTVKALLENKLYEIGSKTIENRPGKIALSGYVIDAKTGEPISGATVFVESSQTEAISNQFGFYSMELPPGLLSLNIKGFGFKPAKRQILLHSPGNLNIEVPGQLTNLKEVVISAQKTSNINRTTMGLESLDIKTIKQVPTVFGEADVLKVVLTLPGVKSVGEASTGFNVRGGATDQNLILFNDATIYNPSHFFGFFSAFNPEIIKNVELYKSSIPAKYGGRLASVLDINTREGNKKKFTGVAGLGLITSRLNIEGPIDKDKTSFILGGRTTYSNWLLNLLPSNSGYREAKASFYDANLNVSHQANSKNILNFTGYISKDESNLGSDTSYSYRNTNTSIKWKHIFGSKFYSEVTTGIDRYSYSNLSDKDPVQAYEMRFKINQNNIKAEFSFSPDNSHSIEFGLSAIKYKLHPGSLNPLSNTSLIAAKNINTEQALESAVYLSDHFTISPSITIDYGIRYSMFNNLGPGKTYTYLPNSPVNSINVTDSIFYDKGDIAKTYHGPEFRVSGRFNLSEDLSIKLGYNSLRQYIHMLTNTSSISPTDIWKLSDPNIKPQYGDQVSLGLYKNFNSNTIETSVEIYYKKIKDFLDYKSGATLILNPTIERELVSTQGKAYGLEIMLKKSSGKLNGWMSYTYSRTLLRMNDPNQGILINGGNYYAANYDKPHDMTFVGNYRFSHRYSASVNLTYSTGRPITLPVGTFEYGGSTRVYYTDRNSYRIPDYFRSDFSINIEGNHKVHQILHNSWTFGVYNLTGRKNPYSTYYNTVNESVSGYKLTIFGTPVPFINYNIRF